MYFDEYNSLFESIDAESLVVTPNQRLSRFITDQFFYWTKSCSSHKSCPKLKSLSYQQWMTEIRKSARLKSAEGSVILSGPQEDFLWRSVIKNTQYQEEHLDPNSWAGIAKQAWSSMRSWRKALTSVESSSADWSLFCHWVKAFEEKKKKLDVIDSLDEQLIVKEQLIKEIYENVVCYKVVHFVGFDHYTPLQKEFIKKLKELRVKVDTYDVSLPSEVARYELSQYKEEIQRSALWAKDKIEMNPTARIGVVSLDLGQTRAMYEEIYSRVFFPHRRLTNHSRTALPFNVSAGEPLSRLPAVVCALDLLLLNKNRLDLEYLKKIFKSPFWQMYEFSHCISSHLAELSELHSSMSQAELTAELRSLFLREDISESFLEPLELIFGRRGSKNLYNIAEPRGFHKWGQLILQQLRCLGWPGTRKLDSIEFQQIQQFQTVIGDFCALSAIESMVTFDEAIEALRQLCYRPFQAQTKKSPIQILGVLEASGMQFDYLWVLGMDNNTWPEKAKPNPLIPLPFQIKYAMPRANPVDELALAENITDRLKSSAHEVVFSSSAGQGDEPLKPSALIADIPLHVESNTIQFPDIFVQSNDAAEVLRDYFNVNYPNKLISGGSQALKSQAACPFQATARFRFNARNYQSLQAGVSPLTRGIVVHDCLEIIWGKIKDRNNLVSLSEETLDELISGVLRESWSQQKNVKHLSLPIKNLEIERNTRLLKSWFNFEKNRDDFTVISCEKVESYQYAGRELHLRIDRIDQLENGSLLVLDYKTGSNSPASWSGIRPDDPQLPLYVIVTPDSRAVAYGQIHPKHTGLIGIAADELNEPGLKSLVKNRQELPEEWPELVKHWQSSINDLILEFSAGLAVVDPKSLTKTCEYCDLSSLCRIKKQGHY